MLRAIAAAKRKPECYMASTAIRERRRTLRCRNLLVRMKNKIGMLLMEAGGPQPANR